MSYQELYLESRKLHKILTILTTISNKPDKESNPLYFKGGSGNTLKSSLIDEINNTLSSIKAKVLKTTELVNIAHSSKNSNKKDNLELNNLELEKLKKINDKLERMIKKYQS